MLLSIEKIHLRGLDKQKSDDKLGMSSLSKMVGNGSHNDDSIFPLQQAQGISSSLFHGLWESSLLTLFSLMPIQ